MKIWVRMESLTFVEFLRGVPHSSLHMFFKARLRWVIFFFFGRNIVHHFLLILLHFTEGSFVKMSSNLLFVFAIASRFSWPFFIRLGELFFFRSALEKLLSSLSYAKIKTSRTTKNKNTVIILVETQVFNIYIKIQWKCSSFVTATFHVEITCVLFSYLGTLLLNWRLA